jgi:hypothetical protein
MRKFTERQIKLWRDYERVRKSGRINMLESRTGCRLASMSEDEWWFCLHNYSELKAAAMEASNG